MKSLRMLAAATALVAATSGMAMAFPTGQINIPSVDAKALKEVTLSVTNNVRISSASDAGTNLFDVGFVTGLLPYEKVKLEVGADYGTYGTVTKQPMTYNAKLATAEDALFTNMPAFAVGGYNLGNLSPDSNAQNIVYGLVAKTVPVVGRFSVGGYDAAKRAYGMDKDSGLLASWDRSITEISDKLWLGIDYMSGKNNSGEVSIGGSWAFSKQITLLVGATRYNEKAIAGRPAFTTQLYINLP